ncbi:DUF6234 family protein [Streptomyces olivochromogenes]|uniref:DUF6234 family protein n=1 Tax=Streptomyces olivochromogenes TaxID=1963 RepID=UPI0036DE4FC9
MRTLRPARQGVAMTDALPEPPPRRRWPWSGRSSLASDVAAGLVLFIVEAVVFGGTSFGYGMQIWAAQGAQAEIDASRLASIAWTERVLFATLLLAGLATLTRAPWTVLSQLLAAGTLAVLLVLSQHDYDRTHPRPAPTPRVGYSPCYSGSGTCH